MDIKIKTYSQNPEPAAPHLVYKVKVELKNPVYPIWRVILFDARDDLAFVQRTALKAMGWDMFDHLYSFEIHRESYIDYSHWGHDGIDGNDASQFGLAQVLGLKDKGQIIYDFGDSWTHTVTVQEILNEYEAKTPWCIKAKGACPLEDCGGIYGFANMLEILEDPDHPEYEDIHEWAGGEFDPNNVSIETINAIISD
ncbi:MAG: plasmid pRiA4b ORF-3 family protein [Desulfovibrionaceae bacterium]|nr:plasmid pRiA4b ORF-3 family protein [Desulfovibrionaceae bacterium]